MATISRLACVHASGRYNAPVGDVVAYLRALEAEEPIDDLSMTEVHQRGLARAIRKAFPDHRVVKSGAYLWMYRTSKLRRRVGRPARRRTITRTKGFPDWRQTRVGVLWLVDRGTGRLVRDLVAHEPAGVESGTRWRTGGRQTRLAVKTHQTADRKLGRIMRETPNAVVLLKMDTNLDYRRKHWRDYMRTALGTPHIWARPPAKGSLRRRLIDAAHYTGCQAARARVSKARKPKTLDHRAVRWTVIIQGD